MPLTFGQVHLPVRGERLELELPCLSLQPGSFDVRLAGDGENGPLVLSGEAELAAGVIDRAASPAPAAPPESPARFRRRCARPCCRWTWTCAARARARAWWSSCRWLPDLHLDLDVQVTGSSTRPKISWQADGKGYLQHHRAVPVRC